MTKVAWVTGGSRGIGAATCRVLSENGYAVAVGYLQNRQAAQQVVDAIRTAGGVAEAFGCDVSDAAAVQQSFEEIRQVLGAPTLLVANAGISGMGLCQDMTSEQVQRLIGVDLCGVIYTAQAVLPDMIRQQSGAIVTVSSIWGLCGAACETIYSAAKAGIIGFTKALAQEVGPSGITVNCVAPGVIDTEMNAQLTPDDRVALCEQTPLGRFGTPEEVAKAILYFANPGFCTGQILSPNGGMVL